MGDIHTVNYVDGMYHKPDNDLRRPKQLTLQSSNNNFPTSILSPDDPVIPIDTTTTTTMIPGASLVSASSSASSDIFSSVSNSAPSNVSNSLLNSLSSSVIRDAKNPISGLQELCVQHKLGFPTYVEAGMMGPPHARLFRIRCHAAGFICEGSGLTKKAAKTLAAKDVLDQIRNDYSKKIGDGFSALTGSILEMNHVEPTLPGTSSAGTSIQHPKFYDPTNNVMGSSNLVKPESRSATPVRVSNEPSNYVERNVVMRNIVAQGRTASPPPPVRSSPVTVQQEASNPPGTFTLASLIEAVSLDDPSYDQEVVQKLYALCGKNGFSVPEYAELKGEGPSHCPTFTVGVKIQSLNLSASGVGKSKTAAKRVAATKMMNQIRDMYPHIYDITRGAKVDKDAEEAVNHRLKYRIPGDKFETPLLVFELFRLLESSHLPEFDQSIEAKRSGDMSFDYFNSLSSICTKLNITLQSFENDCIKEKKLYHESLVIMTYKEIPVLTSYGTSNSSKGASMNQAAFRAIIGLFASNNQMNDTTSD